MPEPAWCDRCVEALGAGDHAACRAARALEPPRLCPHFRRRMRVQVVPRDWTAACVEHVETRSREGVGVNPTDLDAAVTLIGGLAIVVGLLGIVVPMLPGLVLCWAGVLVWAVFAERGWGKWAVLAVATVVALIGLVAKYALPGRNMR